MQQNGNQLNSQQGQEEMEPGVNVQGIDEDDNTDEFDPQFYQNNPGVKKTQKFLLNNLQEILLMGLNNSECVHVNLSYNNCLAIKNTGINSNKRGKLTQKDLRKIREETEQPDFGAYIQFNQAPNHRLQIPSDTIYIEAENQKQKINQILAEIENQNLKIDPQKHAQIEKIDLQIELEKRDKPIVVPYEEIKRSDSERSRKSFISQNNSDISNQVIKEEDDEDSSAGSFRKPEYIEPVQEFSKKNVKQRKSTLQVMQNQLNNDGFIISESQSENQVLKKLEIINEKDSSISEQSDQSGVPSSYFLAPSGFSDELYRRQLNDEKLQILAKIQGFIQQKQLSVNSSSSSSTRNMDICQQLKILHIEFDEQIIRKFQQSEMKILKDLISEFYNSESSQKDSRIQDSSSEEEEEKVQVEHQKSISMGSIKGSLKIFGPLNVKIHESNSSYGLSSQDSSQVKHQLSLVRKNNLENLQMEYKNYLHAKQTIFVIRCQMMNIEFTQNKNLKHKIVNFKKFDLMLENLKMHEIYKRQKTIVIDIENTLLIQVDPKNVYDRIDLIEVDTTDVNKKYLFCKFCTDKQCQCVKQIYLLRPYALEFLRAIQPFFELIIFTRMHKKILERIVLHIEEFLNQPLKENSSQYQRVIQNHRIYFNFILHAKQYIQLKYNFVENLQLLTKNRQQENIILLSSNPFRIIAALNQNFLAIPVLPYESFYRYDFQLNLVENYILKMRSHKEMSQILRKDFQFLLQRIDNTKKIFSFNQDVKPQDMDLPQEEEKQGF